MRTNSGKRFEAPLSTYSPLTEPRRMSTQSLRLGDVREGRSGEAADESQIVVFNLSAYTSILVWFPRLGSRW